MNTEKVRMVSNLYRDSSPKIQEAIREAIHQARPGDKEYKTSEKVDEQNSLETDKKELPELVGPNAGRVRWNRELHRPQPSTSVGAFAVSSMDADARCARKEAEEDEERTITDSYLGSDVEDDEDVEYFCLRAE